MCGLWSLIYLEFPENNKSSLCRLECFDFLSMCSRRDAIYMFGLFLTEDIDGILTFVILMGHLIPRSLLSCFLWKPSNLVVSALVKPYVLQSYISTLFTRLMYSWIFWGNFTSLQWRHHDHDSVSNHQPHDCLLNHLFRRRSKKTSKLHVTGLCVGNSPGPVNSPHKGPVTRKMFPFDDVIMSYAKMCKHDAEYQNSWQ